VHIDIRDIGLMAGKHTGQVEQHAWTIGDGEKDGVSGHGWGQDTGEC
jgi:hypothetical protein